MTKTAPHSDKIIVLLTGNAVLAIDIEEALSSIGYAAFYHYGYDLKKLKTADAHSFDAAIVDLRFWDTQSRQALDWLTAKKIPTIVVSTAEKPDATHTPGVVASFSIPLCVDSMLPSVVAAAEKR
ncbi:hypothetical protein [Cribrihabitans neustonicus]|uniref:hypothetical protein n=1 Tax=Cribrihabitans neustonicus TaxID=1429085 RepID=UPI003B59535B